MEDLDKSRTLLVVDDDPGIRSQLRWGLDEYKVITAESRQQAMEQLMLHNPQVVTLDLGLPPDESGTREGFETLREILKTAPDTRVVVVSAAINPENAGRALNSGAFGYYAKPIDIEKLRLFVEQAYLSAVSSS